MLFFPLFWLYQKFADLYSLVWFFDVLIHIFYWFRALLSLLCISVLPRFLFQNYGWWPLWNLLFTVLFMYHSKLFLMLPVFQRLLLYLFWTPFLSSILLLLLWFSYVANLEPLLLSILLIVNDAITDVASGIDLHFYIIFHSCSFLSFYFFLIGHSLTCGMLLLLFPFSIFWMIFYSQFDTLWCDNEVICFRSQFPLSYSSSVGVL